MMSVKKTAPPPLLAKDDILYFMHIPKTAGSSLITLLDQHYTIEEICPVHEGFKNFLRYDTKERNRFRFIRGHFPYKLKFELDRIPRTITFLRHPVARTLSAARHHYRLEQQGASYFKEKISDISLLAFLNNPVFGTAVSNVAVNYLNDIIGKHPYKKASLQLAKERLESFDVVGLVERFIESLDQLTNAFEFAPVDEIPYTNVDPERSSREEIENDLLDQIMEMNRDEIALYEYGIKLFEKRLKSLNTERKDLTIICQPMLPAANVFFDFKRVDPGRGWYTGEQHPIYGIVRWSGPAAVSRLRFPLPLGNDYTIRFRILPPSAPDILQSLSLTVNAHPISLAMRPDGPHGAAIFEGKIPQDILTIAPVELAFQVHRTVPLRTIREEVGRLPILLQKLIRRIRRQQDDVTIAMENRRVGLLYHWLQLHPC